MNWKILGKHSTYNLDSRECSLCFYNKLKPASYRKTNMVKRRTEVITKCKNKKFFICMLSQ